MAYFGPFPRSAHREGGGFPNPPDDKTVRKSHFCRDHWSMRWLTKLLSAELFRTTRTGRGSRAHWRSGEKSLCMCGLTRY